MSEPGPKPLSFEGVLEACGVEESTLSTARARQLDDEGYCVFERLVERERLERLRAAVEAAGALPPGPSERDKTGTRHVDPHSRGSRDLDGVLAQPEVLAAAKRVIGGPFRICALSCRDPLPGYGEQGLHSDWGPRPPGDPNWVTTAIWILDDFTIDNGATRIVPGTHKLPGTPPKSINQPGRTHPDQQTVTAPAGSVLVFNGHLWHSGTRNGSEGPRRTLQMSFVSRDQLYHSRVTHPAPEELAPAVRWLLDPQ